MRTRETLYNFQPVATGWERCEYMLLVVKKRQGSIHCIVGLDFPPPLWIATDWLNLFLHKATGADESKATLFLLWPTFWSVA